jgi:hypothetical protein
MIQKGGLSNMQEVGEKFSIFLQEKPAGPFDAGHDANFGNSK